MLKEYHEWNCDGEKACAVVVMQHAYRLNPQKRKLLQQEVTYMLDTGLTEPSHSADGSVRFCTDFRKVNALTKADSFLLTQIENCIDQVGHPSMSINLIC